MAAISLFWYTNMAAVTSDENDLYSNIFIHFLANFSPFPMQSVFSLFTCSIDAARNHDTIHWLLYHACSVSNEEYNMWPCGYSATISKNKSKLRHFKAHTQKPAYCIIDLLRRSKIRDNLSRFLRRSKIRCWHSINTRN